MEATRIELSWVDAETRGIRNPVCDLSVDVDPNLTHVVAFVERQVVDTANDDASHSVGLELVPREFSRHHRHLLAKKRLDPHGYSQLRGISSIQFLKRDSNLNRRPGRYAAARGSVQCSYGDP